jgi:hypothetical protein
LFGINHLTSRWLVELRLFGLFRSVLRTFSVLAEGYDSGANPRIILGFTGGEKHSPTHAMTPSETYDIVGSGQN